MHWKHSTKPESDLSIIHTCTLISTRPDVKSLPAQYTRCTLDFTVTKSSISTFKQKSERRLY